MPGTRLSSRDLIARLIAFDTTSRDSNLTLIDFVRDYLDGWGVKSELYFDPAKRKADLFATIGPDDRGGLMLSGHTDTVPVDGQVWDSDPFAATARDGKLYARGSCDMKGFIALALAKVPDMVAARLKTPLHLAFSYDEEVGCIGVRDLIADIARRPVRPIGCIVGEPTLMLPVIAHKGKLTMRCEVHGHESHSALTHEGVNAVEAAAEIVAYLKNMARRKRDEGPYDGAFTPPYTTIHCGTIRGGTAINIVPRECTFDFEIRAIAPDDPKALYRELRDYAEARLLPEMLGVSPDAAIHFHELNDSPGLSIPPDAPIVKLVQSLTGANSTGKVSFAAEAGLFQAADIPTIICGPGSIEQAHKPNEFIALDQIARCETFLERVLEHLRT
ncbi:MAG TPA: acetylornithine deacetylase [Stellaceae bacterium]